MASDDIPESDQPEIIPKPPSHPITTTLLFFSFVLTIVGIGFVWNELFGSYLIPPKLNEAGMENHNWSKLKDKQGSTDHYLLDFPTEGANDTNRLLDTVLKVKKELGIIKENPGE